MLIKANFIRSSNFLVLILLLCIPIFICYSQEVDKEISELEHNIQTRENIIDADDMTVIDSQIKPMQDFDQSIGYMKSALFSLSRLRNWLIVDSRKGQEPNFKSIVVKKKQLDSLARIVGSEEGAIGLWNAFLRIKAIILKQNMLIKRCEVEKNQLTKSIDIESSKLDYKEALHKYWLFLKTAHWMD
ncbi:MAG TPA: hypothetical protein VFF29_05555 [Bacteroidota bacterium]|nr:hypothetical protein [Bacteroidota bacterium]